MAVVVDTEVDITGSFLSPKKKSKQTPAPLHRRLNLPLPSNNAGPNTDKTMCC